MVSSTTNGGLPSRDKRLAWAAPPRDQRTTQKTRFSRAPSWDAAEEVQVLQEQPRGLACEVLQSVAGKEKVLSSPELVRYCYVSKGMGVSMPLLRRHSDIGAGPGYAVSHSISG